MYSDDNLDDFVRQLFPPLPKPTEPKPTYDEPWLPAYDGEEPPF